MNAKLYNEHMTQLSAALIFVFALVFTYFAYKQGISGSLHFDDLPNLGGLSSVHDIQSAIQFSFSGIAGPLGRPLVLATFTPQAYAWPDSPEVFLKTNTLLHLLNAVLVIWTAYLISLVHGSQRNQAALLGSLCGAIWMLLPIHASSALLIVQRMNLLSATFVLVGIIGYLQFRKHIESRPTRAMTGMSITLLICGGLSILSKENGALLPLYILVIESTLLQPPSLKTPQTWKLWKYTFLILPSALITIYVVTRIDYSESMLWIHSYTGPERLGTQTSILWQYLFTAFLPNPAMLTPFHDDISIGHFSKDSILLSSAGWFICITLALLLRKKAPLLLFAIGWFLAGHILESTVLPVELYFEHRNYFPLIGPVFALVYMTTTVSSYKWRVISTTSISAYTLLIGWVLYNTTSLWGNPTLAANMWSSHHPDSQRSVEYLAWRTQLNGSPFYGQEVLRKFLDKHPNAHSIRLQVMHSMCVIQPTTNLDDHLQVLKQEFPGMKFSHGLDTALESILDSISSKRCKTLSRHDIYELAQLLVTNPRYQGKHTRHNLYMLLARISYSNNDTDLTSRYLTEAMQLRAPLPTLYAAVVILINNHQYDASRDIIRDAQQHRPTNPFRVVEWDRQTALLTAMVDDHIHKE